jgi:hypothetical protein
MAAGAAATAVKSGPAADGVRKIPVAERASLTRIAAAFRCAGVVLPICDIEPF